MKTCHVWSRVARFAVVLIGLMSASAQSAELPRSAWAPVSPSSIARTPQERVINPSAFRTVRLNRGQLTAFLAGTPHENSRRPIYSDAVLNLPNAAGGFDAFKVVESPIMAPELAARYPQLKTYLGQGVTDPSATLRFEFTPKGFRAQVIRAEGTEYIDPYQPGDVDHYMVYRKHEIRGEGIKCLVTGETITDAASHAKMHHAKLSSGGTLRTYRLAMAATGEYTQFHGGTKADALAAMVTTMNRVNGMYEREVSVRMVLVANNDLIIFTDPGSDPYANTSADLNANQSTVDAQIGSANYDIGHLVGTGGGGIAQLGSVCGASKARGLTGSGSPVGDAFDIDYVAHEMGHQFAGNHTFNGSGVNCSGGNRNASTAYEVGSGVTIQAYAGICGNDDLQPNSEDHFHRLSLNEIITFTSTGGGSNCDATSATGNAIPTVTSPGDFTIPRGTPFTLTASGSDGDVGDTLTYIWEQFDLGAANPEGVLADDGSRPLFRVFTPTTSPSRTFPSLRYILNNANIVPQRSFLPGTAAPTLDVFSGELLPTTARTMNFRVTVRDNRAGGGGTNEANSLITVINTAAPFAITAPNTNVTWTTGSSQTVTWNVAGTTAAPISTANVAIRLSVDGGNTFPFTLSASTANDGTESITVPANLASTQARVKVEAVGNIYFDISDANFTITTAGNTAPSINVSSTISTRQGSPAANANVATVSDAQDAAGSLIVALSGAPNELSVSAVNNAGTVNVSASAACTLVAPSVGNKIYPLVLTATDSNGATSTADVFVNVGSNLNPVAPTYANRSVTPSSTSTLNPLTVGSDPNNNFSSYSVSPATLPGGGTVSVDGAGVVTVITTAGTTLGSYAITVGSNDTCGAREVSQFTLTVAAPNVSLAISASPIPSGNSLIEPNECNQMNVTLINNGNITATNVAAVLSTLTANVSVTQANTTFANIPPGESRSSITPFEISSASGLACFSNIAFTLTTSFAEAGSPFVGTINKTVGQPANPNYVFTSTNDASLPAIPSGSLIAGSNIDEGLVTVTIPAGFNFSLYGVTRTGGTNLRASANGNLQFRGSQGAADPDNINLPVVGIGSGQARFPATEPTLFLQWDDWRMDDGAGGAGAGAGIYTHLLGTAPNRQWIIEWRGRIRGDGLIANNNRAAIRFTEGSDEFDYLYIDAGVGASLNAATSLIGIQSANSGTTFTQFSNNSASIAAGVRLHALRPAAICTAGSGVCNSSPGVTVTQSGGSTNVTEGGATDTYTVVLNSLPTASVTVNINAGTQVTTVPTPSLTFTTLNWNVPQTVTVTAVDDVAIEGAHTGTITHTASSGDLNYNGISVANVTANITDNDLPSLAINDVAITEGNAGTSTLSFTVTRTGTTASAVGFNFATADGTATTANADYVTASGTGTIPGGGASATTTVNVTINGDAIFENNETFVVNLSLPTNATISDNQGVGTINNDDSAPTLTINDVSISEGNAGTQNLSFTVTRTGLTALAASFTAATADGTAIAPSDYLSALSGSTSIAAGGATGTTTLTATINGDALVEANETFVVNLSAPVNATIADTQGTGTINNDDTAGVSLAQSGGSTNVTEGGTTDTYTLILTSQPSANVSIALNPDAQVTAAISPVVFTSANWNVAQTVTVTAVNDLTVEGAHTGTISHVVTSGDGNYNNFAVANVVANITDNDVAGVTITQSGGTTDVTEGGVSDTYTVVLNAQPSATVTITVTGDAQASAAPTPLIFTTANWNTPQTVTVTAVNDLIVEGAHTGTITHSASGGGYSGVSIANVTANITDNDNAGVTITQTGGTTDVTEGGVTDTYTVVLNAQPSATVTITVTGDAQASAAPTPLSFTTANWNTPQTVTVTAVNDLIVEGAHTGTITHSASGGGYTGVSIANVVANITDNDVAAVTITPSGGTTDVTEGGTTDTYTVVLNAQPSATVTITVTGDAQASAAPTPLSFTTANWNTPQTVTVTAVNDLIVEGVHTGTITHNASGGGYTGVSIANVVANITDNDAPGVTITQSGGVTEVSESGATDTYTVVLNAEPNASVIITLTPDLQLSVSPNPLTFTTANWNVPQTVTVAAFDDTNFEPTPHNGTITHSASGGGYTGVSIANINASIADNDLIPVDLAVSNTVSSANLAPGQAVSYEVTVDNLTVGNNASTASFNFTAPADLVGLSWICVADPGATCPANGSGAPSHNISLNGGTGVSYNITGTVGASVPISAVITTTASVSVTTPFTDPASANNTANANLTVVPEGIFANGFE